MLAIQRTASTLVLVAVDLLVMLAALLGAHHLRFDDWAPLFEAGPHRSDHLVLAVTLVGSWVAMMWLAGLYRLDLLVVRKPLLPRVAVLAPLVGIAVAAALFLFQSKLASRLVFGYALALSTMGLWLGRRLVIAIRRRMGRRAGISVLIVGSGPTAQSLGHYLEEHPELGYRLAGFVTRDGEPQPEGKCLGSESELHALLEQHVIDHVILAAPLAELGRSEPVIQACDEIGVDVSIAAGGLGPRVASLSVDELGGTQLLRLAASPQFRASMLGKRVFDLLTASILLLASTPLMALAALLVKLTSRGPVLFVQPRVGLNGRQFSFLKFRTMVDGAHAMRGDLENEVGGPVFKMKNDPRVTPIGGFLRRYSIDELPQLFNVISGHMSLVGPRPPLPEEVEQYDRWQRRRLSVKPGITCTWQVSGRSEIGFDEWMKLDLDYIDNWSPWLDLKILARTIPAVLSRRGAA